MIEVDAWDLSAALDAEACFEGAVALDLEDPEHVQWTSFRWDVGGEYDGPCVIANAGVEFLFDGWAPVRGIELFGSLASLGCWDGVW